MPKKLTLAAKLDIAKKFATVYDPDPDHAEHVRRNSLALFDALHDLHGLGARERFLLEAAAVLHDIGYATRAEQHQKGSRDLIIASELEGFTPKELAVIACIARYHGKNLPKASHKVYKDLRKPEQEIVRKLAALIRIADGLDRSHSGTAMSDTITRTEDAVTLHTPRGTSDYDIDAATRKADLFETVFGMRFRITVAHGS